ncbi:1-acyl-sn-glycerol-3-phosphate acyltransferase [Salinicoccus sp. ID82-1]|uniref:1-acyl-sn-glycerol-3-phosphate acyltransferase n=1 Tax=Salinicoccus cyprini TaxID=2493691 RepID=A0A558AZ24_9STAP|nr:MULTISPECIES: lysophospholipid acyltransferase family protein [Salinicoccus]MCG1009082.1 1-acyl-sn-glycerol-3-phosphate acyltransferase [Salinicoccus sp. ID82-1]TVT29528.1 1-acyl-sn-glycerol-3-phosphate acyltransferase [Salinicoccus cyprini]
MLYGTVKAIVKKYYQARFKIRVIGEDRIPADGPVLICSNHTSLYDPPLIAVSVKREMSFFAKSELFRIPVLGNLISRLNAVPVERGKGDRAALKKSIEVLEGGSMLLVFPEGSRNKSGTLKDLQQGASFMAVKAEAQIVPAAIKGSYDRKKGITIVFGKPIDTKSLIESGKNRKDITENIKDGINNLLISG